MSSCIHCWVRNFKIMLFPGILDGKYPTYWSRWGIKITVTFSRRIWHKNHGMPFEKVFFEFWVWCERRMHCTSGNILLTTTRYCLPVRSPVNEIWNGHSMEIWIQNDHYWSLFKRLIRKDISTIHESDFHSDDHFESRWPFRDSTLLLCWHLPRFPIIMTDTDSSKRQEKYWRTDNTSFFLVELNLFLSCFVSWMANTQLNHRTEWVVKDVLWGPN